MAAGASEKACGDPTATLDPTCRASADCRGLPHIDCTGHWDCHNGGCLWLCDGAEPGPDNGPPTDAGPGPAPECTQDADCGEELRCDKPSGQCVPADDPAKCFRTGCSGEVCAAEPIASICIWLEWYACLSLTECEVQGDGACGFTPNEAFLACMNGQECSAGGDCPEGTRCIDGRCRPAECIPTDEVCDGVDNDCDGEVDEGCAATECRAVQPGTHGQCKMLLGYFFDGQDCFREGGCDCAPDCDAMFDSLEACRAACGLACNSDADCGVGTYCNQVLDESGNVTGHCDDLPEGTCVRDADCGTGGRCVIGACPACFPCPCFGTCHEGRACAGNGDCAAFEQCIDGQCTLAAERCWDDGDCPEGRVCEGAWICPPGALCLLPDEPGRCAEPSQACQSDQDCGPGAYCLWTCDGSAGGCRSSCQPLPDGLCVKDQDCEAGEVCVKGPCPLCVNCPCFGECKARPRCAVIEPGTHGMCAMVLGWVFDGEKCVLESGCACGDDCDAFFASEEACRKACVCTPVTPASHGACEMVLGWIFDGERCVVESGCSCGDDCEAFFPTAEDCDAACL